MSRLNLLIIIGCAVVAGACGSSETPTVPAPVAQLDSAPTESAAAPAPAPSVSTAPARSASPATTRVRERAPEVAVSREESSPAPTRVPPAPKVSEYREVVIPAGTPPPLTLQTPVRSDSSQVEDLVRATLREDVRLADDVVLPAGAEVRGRITDVERSGRVKGRARLAFRFTTLTRDGDEYDVRTLAIERVAAATKGEDATKVGIGAGAGAALGAILGGGSGAAKGAAIGAAAGTGAVLATRGEEVQLNAGEPVDTRLTSELPVRIHVRGSGR